MEIARRAFLEQVFGAPLALSLTSACRSPQTGRLGEHLPGALLGQDAAAGHLLRGELRERLAHVATLAPTRTSVLIAGGGPAGLSTAFALARADFHDFVLLELEPVLGGTARGAASAVTAYPWGAHYLPVPQRHNVALTSLLREMGVVTGSDDAGELVVSEPHLVRAPEERLFYKGYWYPGLYLEAGATPRDLAERTRFEQLVARWVGYRDSQGRRAFSLPTRLCSDAPEVRALDRISGAQLLQREGLRSRRLWWLLDYACRDDYGTRLEQTSAWALLFYFAARSEHPFDPASDLITWPEGNFALVRHLQRAALRQTRTRMLVLDVYEQDGEVELLAWDLARDVGTRYRAAQAVVATPRFITQRIVRSQRELARSTPSSEGASYAPWLVANLHLRERPSTRGAALAWDNVLHDSPSLGYVCATHQRGSDYGPTVLTYYLPLSDPDPKRARQKLYDGDLAAWREALLLDLGRAHPELVQQLERVDVFRWGHAMVRPEVGSIWQPARLAAREPQGAIHFAHSDLSGLSLFEEAFDHGVRAAAEVLGQLGRPSVL
ncbi:MAG: hypothetical protein JWN48_1024 [Myxococcaceae bacterium]|nr:hypothetical protein [Myxococcaceae bacterium]